MEQKHLQQIAEQYEATISVLINNMAESLSNEELDRVFDACVMGCVLKDCAKSFRKYGITLKYLKEYPFNNDVFTYLYFGLNTGLPTN